MIIHRHSLLAHQHFIPCPVALIISFSITRIEHHHGCSKDSEVKPHGRVCLSSSHSRNWRPDSCCKEFLDINPKRTSTPILETKKQPVSLLPNAGVHEITEKRSKQKSNTKEGTMLTKNWRTKARWKRENKDDCSCTYIWQTEETDNNSELNHHNYMRSVKIKPTWLQRQRRFQFVKHDYGVACTNKRAKGRRCCHPRGASTNCREGKVGR
jgi:hypothetical protein